MWNAKRPILVVILCWAVAVPVCWARTDDTISGRELLRARRQRDRRSERPPPRSRATRRTARTEAQQGQTRILHFPRDRSLGTLKVLTDTPEHHPSSVLYAYADQWEYVAQAKGDVAVPADKPLLLLVRRPAQDLSPLANLRPDDLHILSIEAYKERVYRPDETMMPHLSGLTGLEILHILGTNITNRGLQHIKGLKSLKHLALVCEPQLGNAALATVAELTGLEGLCLSNVTYSNEGGRITDEGLRHLGKLTSLKELTLVAPKVRGPGLAYLAKLPSLRNLTLAGENFGDAQMEYLQDIHSLKKLTLRWVPVTDAGMKYLGNLTNLEELRFKRFGVQHITEKGLAHISNLTKLTHLEGINVSDKGLNHLNKMTKLKKLSLHMSPVSNETEVLKSLKKFQFLEYLYLKPATDKGIAHVAQLTELRSLDIGGNKLTDAGLSQLAKIKSLEELDLQGEHITDAGMGHIGELTNLKSLRFGEAMMITDQGMAKLAALQSLESIDFELENATIAGLNHLNQMPRFTEIRIAVGSHGDAILNLSGLNQLKKLELRDFPVRDQDLACLAQLPRLEKLTIGGPISDAGLFHLGGLTNLHWLGIGADDDYAPHITDAGLSYLRNLNRLELLHISGVNNLTDEGLGHLGELKALRHLNIKSKNALSHAALQRLRNNLPNIQNFNVESERDQRRPRHRR